MSFFWREFGKLWKVISLAQLALRRPGEGRRCQHGARCESAWVFLDRGGAADRAPAVCLACLAIVVIGAADEIAQVQSAGDAAGNTALGQCVFVNIASNV